MQRKRILYLMSILALLAAMLPMGATAQGEAPVAPEASLQIEVAQSQLDAAESGKPAAAGVLPEAMVAPDGMTLFSEIEPNGTAATATALPATGIAAVGTIFPNGDLDYFSFTGSAGDKVYAATMTSFSASGSVDSYLTLFDSDGVTVIEDDNDNGTFGSTASSIAGATLPGNGTYYLQVRHNSATGQLRPYRLHLKVQSGAPGAETEPNDTPATANPLPPSGWVSGSTSATTDLDFYSLSLNAGDTVFLSLDLDPERDATEWNGQLGLGVFNNNILTVNDAGTTGPDSEAFFMTVKDAGTYYPFVAVPSGGTTFGTYTLSVAVYPAAAAATCTTYTSTDVPVIIPTGPGMVQSTLTVPGNPRIADIDVSIELTHTFMADLDAHLMSPAGNDNGLFTDVGNTTVGSPNIQMNTTLDDEAGIPIGAYTIVSGMNYAPELAYRLSWFDGTDAGGVWTLKLYDDATGDGGVLQSWSITVCEPPPPPACPVGYEPVTLYSSDFEADDGGFTHSGVQDEWERGTPSFTPLTTCASGSNCWVTDLDDTYNASSNQDLVSPAIDLTAADLAGPVTATWSQRYHIESATFDNAYVQVREAGGANPSTLWTWLDATMNSTVGSPSTTIAQSAGWGVHRADISSYLGQNIDLLFKLSSDTTVQLAGLAIDDVSVTACQAVPTNPSISLDKTVGTDPAVCATTDEITLPYGGGDVTYCFEVTNTGDVSFNTHDLVDSELGVLLNNFSYTLAPGASAFITETTYIGVTTVNTATWEAYNTFDGGPPPASASDVATVTVQTPSQPAISLVKTVGTTPGVCAATDNISVPAGTTVYYCYQVENTGDVTLNFHDLVDSELGALVSNLPYILAPGAFSPEVIVPETINIDATNVATWTATTMNFIDISATGTALNLTDDGEANITSPFPFTFFGATSSDLRVGNNGGILFGVTTGDLGLSNAALPAASGLPAPAILPFWDDLDDETGNVYWEVQGAAPNRKLIVQWHNRPHFNGVGAATFEVILYETSNAIEFLYLDTDFGNPTYDFGASATSGLQESTSSAVQYSFNQAVLLNSMTIRFDSPAYTPVVTMAPTASATDSATVTALFPNIDVAPLSLSSNQATNTTTNQPLNIGNTGQAPLTWEIAETEPDAAPRSAIQAAPEPVFNVPASVSSKADCAAFENYPGREPLGWAEFCGQPAEAPASSPLGPTSNGYSVDLRNDRIVRFALNNFPGQVLVGPQTGNLYGLDFDSTATTLYALNDATIDQLGTVDTATGVFTSIVDCPAPAAGTWTGLSIDPVTNIFYASTAANLYTLDPATCSPTLIGPFGVTGGIMIDIAIGSAGVMYGHDIFTDSIYTIDTSTGAATLVGATGFAANFAQGLDFDNEDGTLYIWLYIGTGANRYGTVNLATGVVTPLATDNPLGEFEGATQTLGTCVPSDYGWLSLTPITGTTAPAAATPVDVTFDSTGLPAGVYTGQLCIRSNDPDNGPGNETNLVVVPVTLTVTAPTAVTLSGLAAASETAPTQAPLPLAGLPLAALPAVVGLALGAAYALRRRQD